jgi:hypothetical protein
MNVDGKSMIQEAVGRDASRLLGGRFEVRQPVSDLIQKQWALHSAIAIFVYWVLVFSVPFFVSDRQTRSDTPLWFWCGLCAVIGYFSYTGIRAWKRGWKARFILRIIVPAALLGIGCIAVGLMSWLG